MNNVGILTALAGGLISFVSPCVLPLVPPYLCYIGGVSIEELGRRQSPANRRRAALSPQRSPSCSASPPFSSRSARRRASSAARSPAICGSLTVVGGVLIILMGLHFLGLFRLALLNREARIHLRDLQPGLIGAYGLGLAFAFGWTPCIGPVLAAILALAGGRDTVGQGAFLLIVYSLGLGIPFLAAAFFAPLFLSWLKGFPPLSCRWSRKSWARSWC